MAKLTPSVVAFLAVVTLAGCGVAGPATAPQARAGLMAARDVTGGFNRMELEYTYRLGGKAAKAFMTDAKAAAEPYEKRGTKCELKADAGFFGTTIHVKLVGEMEPVTALRKELDALHKSHK